VVSHKFVTNFSRHSGRAGGNTREPESRKYKVLWIPACAGMTINGGADFVSESLTQDADATAIQSD